MKAIHAMVLAGEYHASDPEFILLEAILGESRKPYIEPYPITWLPLTSLIVVPLIIVRTYNLHEYKNAKAFSNILHN